MGLLLATNIDRQPLLPVIDQAIKNLFNEPADAFYTGPVMDILFNGIPIYCHSVDHITAGMCYSFQNEKSFKRLDTHHYTFSLFGGVSLLNIIYVMTHFEILMSFFLFAINF